MTRISYDPELDNFAFFLSENAPKLIYTLAFTVQFPSEQMDEILRYMLSFGKYHWVSMANVASGLPSLN